MNFVTFALVIFFLSFSCIEGNADVTFQLRERPEACHDYGPNIELYISGNELEANDLAAFYEVIESKEFEGILHSGGDLLCGLVISLNFQGGSVSTALEIRDVLMGGTDRGSRNNFETIVRSGNACESACTYIFMAGWFNGFEANPYYERYFEPGGRLGFHAPFAKLKVVGNPETSLPISMFEELQEAAFAEAFTLISDLLSGDDWPVELVQQMLAYGPGEQLYLESVGQAVDWNIQVKSDKVLQIGSVNEATDVLTYACENAQSLNSMEENLWWVRSLDDSYENTYDPSELYDEAGIKRFFPPTAKGRTFFRDIYGYDDQEIEQALFWLGVEEELRISGGFPISTTTLLEIVERVSTWFDEAGWDTPILAMTYYGPPFGGCDLSISRRSSSDGKSFPVLGITGLRGYIDMRPSDFRFFSRSTEILDLK